MVFRIQRDTYNVGVYAVKAWLRSKFLSNLSIFATGANEVALNRYCVANYGKTLKRTCVWLFDNSSVKLGSGFIRVLFEDEKLDEIATLITYGNGRLQGSKILAWSLGRVD